MIISRRAVRSLLAFCVVFVAGAAVPALLQFTFPALPCHKASFLGWEELH